MLRLRLPFLLLASACSLLIPRDPVQAQTRPGPESVSGRIKLGEGKKAIEVIHLTFNKKQEYPNTCFAKPPIGVQFGNILICPIDAPKGYYVVFIQFRCEPGGGPCDHTVECPGGGICTDPDPKKDHRYATNPPNLNIGKYTHVDWFGWTNDGNNTLLNFTVGIAPLE